jgi:hypothetical protein
VSGRFRRRQESGADDDPVRTERQRGDETTGVGDAAGGDDRCRRDRVDDARNQGQGGDGAGEVPARFDPLGDHRVDPGVGRADGLTD